MAWTPDNLSVKGALAAFHQALESTPSVYDKHCMMTQSTTDTEAYTFPGFTPAPRQFLDGRQFQGMRDFRYNVTNNEYELSLIVTRKNWEDDQTGLINARFSETGEVWATYKDALFAALLAAGNVSGSLGWDGTLFHSATHTAIGGSGTFANSLTGAVTDEDGALGTGMTVAEAQGILTRCRAKFYSFLDDQGRPFNTTALRSMRMIINAAHEQAFAVASNAAVISQTTNVFSPAIIQGYDVLPYLALQTEVYASALGSVRKPFIYQERTRLEVEVLTTSDQIALNNGVMLLTRQRFIETYGEPRRSILFIGT